MQTTTRARTAERAMVRPSSSLTLGDVRHLPPGAGGAIVSVQGAGVASVVEFIAPFHAIATATAADLQQDPAA